MITFTVNGNKHEFSGDPSKFGCGMAQCGACTVHINGMAQRSCVLPVSAVQGREITTIEGLSENGDHPVQKAWVEHKVPQCGFCHASCQSIINQPNAK